MEGKQRNDVGWSKKRGDEGQNATQCLRSVPDRAARRSADSGCLLHAGVAGVAVSAGVGAQGVTKADVVCRIKQIGGGDEGSGPGGTPVGWCGGRRAASGGVRIKLGPPPTWKADRKQSEDEVQRGAPVTLLRTCSRNDDGCRSRRKEAGITRDFRAGHRLLSLLSLLTSAPTILKHAVKKGPELTR